VSVALDMSKAFDTVNIHKLIHKIHNTDIPHTITKYIANYIKGRNNYTQFNGTNSKHRHMKTGVPQGGVLSPTLFNIYTSDIPTVHLITYADDITILSSHKQHKQAQAQIQPYLEQIHSWTQHNQLTLNATKTQTTLFTPDPAEYSTTLTLKIQNTELPTTRNPKILGVTFDPKLTYSQHIKQTTQKAKQTLKVIKALTSTHWGKTKETLLHTYKTITRPVLEYSNTVWSPITSDTNINSLQKIQNTALRVATGCTQDTNIQHLHDETQILPLKQHLKLHASQYRQKTLHPDHPLHHLTHQDTSRRHKKQTIYDNNNNYTTNIDTTPDNTTTETIKQNMKTIHTQTVQTYINNKQINKVLNRTPPEIDKHEQTLPKHTRRQLAQLRTNKSPLLYSYLHKISPDTHTSPDCPLCTAEIHDTTHLFDCPAVPTSLVPEDLWADPVGVAPLIERWVALLEQ